MIRKLLTLLVIVAIFAVVKAYGEAQEVFSGIGNFGLALDGGKISPLLVQQDGTNAIITVFDKDFNEVEQITVKRAYVYMTPKESKPYYKNNIYTMEYPLDSYPNYIYLTRNFFTNDGSWNVVLRDENQERTFVCATDGKELFELPKGNYYGESVLLFTGYDSKPYYTTYSDLGDDKRLRTVWKFDSSNKTVIPTVVSRQAIASPNPLPSGETLKITLPREADNHTVVTITDINGRQELRERVREGEAQISVSPRFAHGLYIFTVIYGNGDTVSGKVAAE